MNVRAVAFPLGLISSLCLHALLLWKFLPRRESFTVASIIHIPVQLRFSQKKNDSPPLPNAQTQPKPIPKVMPLQKTKPVAKTPLPAPQPPAASHTPPPQLPSRYRGTEARQLLQTGGYVHPHYPRRALRRRQTGRVVLQLAVEQGQLQICRIHASSGFPLLDQAAVDAVRQWRFQKGMQHSFLQVIEFMLDSATAGVRDTSS